MPAPLFIQFRLLLPKPSQLSIYLSSLYIQQPWNDMYQDFSFVLIDIQNYLINSWY